MLGWTRFLGDSMAYLIGEPLIISGEIQGYRVVDESGVFRNIKLDDIDKLAKKRLINAETIKDDVKCSS